MMVNEVRKVEALNLPLYLIYYSSIGTNSSIAETAFLHMSPAGPKERQKECQG